MSEVAHALPPSGEGRVSGERTHGYNYLETRASRCAVHRGVGSGGVTQVVVSPGGLDSLRKVEIRGVVRQ